MLFRSGCFWDGATIDENDAIQRNVWTGCGTQSRSSLDIGCRRYVSGLLDRHAGRGLDGNTRASLVSLADRSSGDHYSAQTLDTPLNPFHAEISVANLMASRGSKRSARRRTAHCIAEHSRRSAPVCWPRRSQACFGVSEWRLSLTNPRSYISASSAGALG